MNGHVLLILQSHLPLVRHPDHPRFLEERWLFEALSETYLPLLRVMDGWRKDGIRASFTLSLSPTLTFMLRDEVLMERYADFLDRNIELAESEITRTRSDGQTHAMAEYYRERYVRDREDLDDVYARDIVGPFVTHAREGLVELMATAATYPFLPNYRNFPELVRTQIELGIESHVRDLGLRPRGFWLPQCGYYEGLDEVLASFEIEYFVGAAHSVLFGDPAPTNGSFAPVRTPGGPALFPRDIKSAHRVWSADAGYPSDPAYRDFYRDIGHDLPLSYIEPYVHEGGVRIDTGFKYHAITGPTDDKDWYNLEAGLAKAQEHARDYVAFTTDLLAQVGALVTPTPAITAPYDTELFGHWWFEGVQWLDAVLRTQHNADQAAGGEATMITPSQYLDRYGTAEVLEPTYSSWGSRGYAEVWLDGSNDWIYRHLHRAIERMGELVARFPDESGLKERALNQAAREVLLAMASDWPLMMSAGTVVQYSQRRVCEHIYSFTRVYEELSRRAMGTEWLTGLEKRHPVFPQFNYRRMRLPVAEALMNLR